MFNVALLAGTQAGCVLLIAFINNGLGCDITTVEDTEHKLASRTVIVYVPAIKLAKLPVVFD
jgi:hypothetical protein